MSEEKRNSHKQKRKYSNTAKQKKVVKKLKSKLDEAKEVIGFKKNKKE